MEAQPIRVTSLRGAVEAAAAAGFPRAATVARVRADEASPLLVLLTSLESSADWALKNRLRLKRAVIAVDLLSIVGSSLLPVLADEPTNKRALRELRRYSFRVKDCAEIVGGSFGTEARRVVGLLLNHRNRARQLVGDPALVENVKRIRNTIAAFKTSHLGLSEDEDEEVEIEDKDEDEDEEIEIEDDDDDDDRAPPPRHGSGRKRGRQVAAPTVRATSLKQAMEAALEAAGSPREVLVVSVHLRHATALEELLRFQDLRNGWSLLNLNRLQSLALVDKLLSVISGGVLPILADNPADERLLHLLHTLLGQIADGAADVDGVIALTDSLLELVRDARLHPLVTRSWLAWSARRLIGRITTFRSRQLTVPLGP